VSTPPALFESIPFGADERAQLDKDGHLVLPGLLTPDSRERLTASLSHIQSLLPGDEEHRPNHYCAEYDKYLASLIDHPQMLDLARRVLGEDIRFDHCVSLNRPGGNDGSRWHSHGYSEQDAALGFVRIFFYVNGFEMGDGNLKVVPGSHLHRDPAVSAVDDGELREGWMSGRTHPVTGQPLDIEELEAPQGSVALMWTHAAHGVNARLPGSDTRWTVVYAYRNPGAESRARWITPKFQASLDVPDSLMALD
jgi:hypothetical protein